MTREFMQFTLPNRKTIWLLGLASLASAVVYLIASKMYYGVGFPLDDSWIHLTYARNLALHGEWAFQPGKPSAGSTAPLWTAILSVGFLFKLAPYLWTYFLGVLLLWGMGILGEMVVSRISSDYQGRIPFIGLFLVLEWHLVWMSMSGMETILHALLVTIVLSMLMIGSRRFMTLGLLTGLSVWVRPDGITLLGPIIFYALAGGSSAKERWRGIGLLLIGFSSIFVPYLLFNLILAGTPMPNTFYAKQAEYVAWQARPLMSRFGELSLQFLAGPSLALLPGVIWWLIFSLRKRNWGTLAGMFWFAGYLFLYVERLPVYQHGRYIMPAMPIFFLWGLAAIVKFSTSNSFGRYHWVFSATWILLTGMLCGSFFFIGANTYAQDVSLIESEMVVTAKWVAKYIPSEKLVAAHDIGALGYYDEHEILDLAGLISPEVIPFMRDEEQLKIFLDKEDAAYLIAFPEFYPVLSEQLEPVFISGGKGVELGGESMVVYRFH